MLLIINEAIADRLGAYLIATIPATWSLACLAALDLDGVALEEIDPGWGLELRQFRIPEIALGALITFAFGATIFAFHPKNYQTQTDATQTAPQISSEALTNERIANYNEALDWLTGGLVFSTVGLWIVTWLAGRRQSRDMKASVAAAHRSADIAEKAMLSIEIPYLYPFIRSHGFITGVSSVSGQLAVMNFNFGNDFIKYYFKNFGRTPAEITEVQSLLLPSRGALEPSPTWGTRNLNPLSGHIVAANGGESQDYSRDFNKGFFDVIAAQTQYNPNTHIFWFVGYVRYNDVFQNEYLGGFCLGYSPMTNSFYPSGGEGYNYRIKTKSVGKPILRPDPMTPT